MIINEAPGTVFLRKTCVKEELHQDVFVSKRVDIFINGCTSLG